jgi:hypothetical protein
MRRVIDQDGLLWVCEEGGSATARSATRHPDERVTVSCLSAEQQVTLRLPPGWETWSDVRLGSAIKGELWRRVGAPGLADAPPRGAELEARRGVAGRDLPGDDAASRNAPR